MIWNKLKNKKPTAYRTGHWDGRMTDEILVETGEGTKHIAHAYEYDYALGELEFYDTDDDPIYDVALWAEIEPSTPRSLEVKTLVQTLINFYPKTVVMCDNNLIFTYATAGGYSDAIKWSNSLIERSDYVVEYDNAHFEIKLRNISPRQYEIEQFRTPVKELSGIELEVFDKFKAFCEEFTKKKFTYLELTDKITDWAVSLKIYSK